MQGLRAAKNAGFNVPKGTIEAAVKYLEKCKTPEGGIEYSLGSGTGARLPISAAAIATLYSAGSAQGRQDPYDSPLANDCLRYVVSQFNQTKGAVVEKHRSRILHPSVRIAGVLSEGRQILGRLFPRNPRSTDRHAKTATAAGTATASARSTVPRSARSSCSCLISFFRYTNDKPSTKIRMTKFE